jgi:DNA-directed RNA polymerase alpha subunit
MGHYPTDDDLERDSAELLDALVRDSLGKKLVRRLYIEGIRTLQELERYSVEELLDFRQIGRLSIQRILERTNVEDPDDWERWL